MRAVVLTGHGGPEKLEYREDYPKPVAESGEVVFRVMACGVNNTDINTRTGWYNRAVRTGTTTDATGADDAGSWGGSIDFPRVQGADVCGIVEEIGQGVDESWLGKRILVDTWIRDGDHPKYFGSEVDGGFAEYSKCPVASAHAIDCDLSHAELATFATSYITAENMLNRASVGLNDTVLIPGASGGVGSALIQLCKRRGAVVVAMCSPAKAAQVEALGADAVLPREPEDLEADLRAALNGREKVDVLADVVGGPYWPKFLAALDRGGRFVSAGAIAGPIVEFDLRTFYLNDLSFFGATDDVPISSVFLLLV